MCFGNSGPSASALYAAQKPTFGALPSLAMDKVKRDKPKLEDVKRKGYQARSLLMPTDIGDY
jgi:hypothetical protein